MHIETIESLLAYAFSAIVVVSGCGFIACCQPVHSALNFTAAVLASAGLYLLQDAPYVAAAMVAVYAGATIIIFLFALMFAQQSRLLAYDRNLYHFRRSLLAAAAICGVLIYAIEMRSKITATGPVDSAASSVRSSSSVLTELGAEMTSPSGTASGTSTGGAQSGRSVRVVDLGRVLYTRYLWSVELAGTLLLISTVGAILMAERDPVAESPAGDSVR